MKPVPLLPRRAVPAHDAVLTICLFNFMNRLLEGRGVKGNRELYETRG